MPDWPATDQDPPTIIVPAVPDSIAILFTIDPATGGDQTLRRAVVAWAIQRHGSNVRALPIIAGSCTAEDRVLIQHTDGSYEDSRGCIYASLEQAELMTRPPRFLSDDEAFRDV
jgi:hypothetical protein